jgi:two-component system KDP operon response regulator KdpE
LDERKVPAILVIDDEPAIHKLIRIALAGVGVKVLSCESAEGAKELSKQATAVLCDIHLKSEDGLQIARELKQSGFKGPLIMISGDGTRHTVTECAEAGVTDYLLKPFSQTLLIEKLRKHLVLGAGVSCGQG